MLSGKTVPLVIGAGGEFIDAVAQMTNLMRVDPTADLDNTPLFRDPGTNKPLQYSEVLRWTRALMAAIGENPLEFGTHSYRIGGATALFAMGADPTVIRTMGRWSSDCYKLYVRACFSRCADWTRCAGSAKVSDSIVEYSEVDFYCASTTSRGAVADFIKGKG